VKRLFDLRPHYREALAYYVAFQRLGFDTKAVIFEVTRIEGLSVIQLVLKNGIKQFSCNVDKVRTAPVVLERGWEEAKASWEVASEEERTVVLRRSYVARNADEFLAGYVGRNVRDFGRVEQDQGRALDIISGATVTVMVIDDSITRSVLKVARALGLGNASSATRDDEGLSVGGSPRAGLMLIMGAKSLARFAGRDFVTPDDIKTAFHPTMRHRIVLSASAELEGASVEDTLGNILDLVEVPR